jgi:hypothetical protein
MMHKKHMPAWNYMSDDLVTLGVCVFGRGKGAGAERGGRIGPYPEKPSKITPIPFAWIKHIGCEN